jgi:hypothetical protein
VGPRTADGFTVTPTAAGRHLFLDISPAGAADHYLNGPSYDVASNVTVAPFHLTLARHAASPGFQSFWVIQTSGSHPVLAWTRDLRLLFMLVRAIVLAARAAVTQAVALSAATTVAVAVASRISQRRRAGRLA